MWPFKRRCKSVHIALAEGTWGPWKGHKWEESVHCERKAEHPGKHWCDHHYGYIYWTTVEQRG